MDDLAVHFNTNRDLVYRILTGDLGLKSVRCKWVPHELSQVNKDNRVQCCTDMIVTLERRNMKRKLIITDEKWFYSRPIGNSKTNRAWVGRAGDVPQIARRTISDRKLLAMVAVTFEGHSFVKVVNGTVDSDVYIQFIRQVLHHFQVNHNIQPENAFLQHDNARPHVSHRTNAYLNETNVTLIKQAPYSPDTNILDRFVFPMLEMSRSRLSLNTPDNVEQYINHKLSSISQRSWTKQFNKLIEVCEDIIEHHGSYL